MIALSEFQRYLQSILDTSREDAKREVSDRYIPTLAELPLQVQTAVSSQPNSQEQQNERREQFAVLEGLRKYAPDRVLLVGKPGSGKSTSLRRLLWEESRHCLEAIEQGKREIPPIPILIELRGLKGSVLAAIQEKLGWWLDLDEKNLKAFLRDRGLFLLLDGLNELPNEQAWQEVDQFRQVCADLKVPLIITTRELGSGVVQGNVKKLEMLPLTEPQMREFVQKQLPETGGELWRQIQGKLRELAETPLLLKMLCDVFKQNHKNIPKSRGDLFRKEFARRYEEFKPERYRNVSEDSRRFAFDLLSYLAFTMVQGEPHTDPCQPSASWITIPKTQAEKILATFLAGDRTSTLEDTTKAKEWLEDLVEWHLLQVASDRTHIEFHHQLFQEYYAAEWLAPQLENLSDEELQCYYLNYLKWTEPLAMSMSFVESNTLAVRMVKLAIDVDLYLAARLTGEATISLQQETVSVLLQKNFQTSLTIWLLEQTQSQNALPFLLDVLKNGCSDTRWRAARALGNFANTTVSTHLIEALKDQDSSVRQKAVESLGKLGNPEVVTKLYQLLDDDFFWVRSIVVDVLGELEGRAAIDCLKSALKHEDGTVKTRAAESLGQRVPQEVIALLNEQFNSGNADTKRDALQLLGDTKNAAAIPTLIRALSEGDWLVRSEAVTQIGLLGIWLNSAVLKDAVTALIDLLQSDPETSIRSSAALHLGFIGDSRAVPVLIEALSKDDRVVRSSAANALGRIQDQSAISPLIRSLKDIDDNVCEEAIRSLRMQNAMEVLPTLRKFLHYKPVNVRGEIILSLGFFGDSKDIPSLYQALKDKEFIIQIRAAYSLSKLNNRKGVPILEDALNTGNKDARLRALRGMQNFQGKAGLASIISTAFKDDEYSIRKEAIDFLEAFKESQEVVNQLKKALDSLNEDICRNAMDAAKTLGNAEVLSRLRQIAETIIVVERPLEAIATIQSRCKLYNYDIARLPPPRKTQSEESSIEDLVHNKLDILTQEFKKVSQEPKRVINTNNYFEQGIHTHTHNYANDETLKQQTIELRQLVHQIQQTHQPTTEVQAAEIIDVEFREIQNTNPTQWEKIRKQLQILKRQLFNPESHFKATKATLAEIAKHYLEESVVSKALITYVDTMSADSD